MNGSKVLLVVLLAVGAASSACKREDDDGTAPQPVTTELPALTIRDDTPNLLLTWIDEKGGAHVELEPARVPSEGRSLVRVVVTDRPEGTREAFYVVDLTQKREDGSYVAKTMSRKEWEALIEKRREAYLAKNAPKPAAPPPGGSADDPSGAARPVLPPGKVSAVVYGASWCKACHETARYLRSKGVSVIEKDVEESPGAAREMQALLDKSGQRGGSIPVTDVRGQVVVGYSPRALDRAIERALAGTAL